MKLDPEQLEWIVQEVIRRLQGYSSSGSLSSGGRAGEGGRNCPAAPHADRSIKLSDRLVTLAQLEGQLSGVARVEVAHRAVITPAARDLLKERGVELVRGEKT